VSFELPDGVGGLHAYQPLPDIDGKNGVEGNTTTYGSGGNLFSELLSEKIEKASQPKAKVSGINPQKMSGVGIAGTTPNVAGGNIINTGNPLDLAIEGEGYFVLSNGQQNIYSRSGAFTVDSHSYLVDPVTGYSIQRIGPEGESDGFQTPGDSNVHVPYRAVMSANGTSRIKVSGNLSSDAKIAGGPQTQVIASNISYTTNSGTAATTATEISQLDQFSGGSGLDGQLEAGESGTIGISGCNPDGRALSEGLTFTVNPATTLGDFFNHLNTNVLSSATASLVDGKIQITDSTGGYSRTDITLSYSGNGSLTMPGYFEILSAGGEEVKNAGIMIYDSQGEKHVLTSTFVRVNKPNTWDMVLSSVTGDVSEITMANRRIENICFDAIDSSFSGLDGSNLPQFVVTFAHDSTKPQAIEIQMGTTGKLDGLTQFKGSSTAAVREQDGYEAGMLSAVSVNGEGMIIGSFSNGMKRNIAALQMTLFQKPSGPESIGRGYFVSSADSGEEMAVRAMSNGAGMIHSGVVEKSNGVVVTEFANIVQSQNGFQANERVFNVAGEILNELGNLYG
jgi:flagellar hook protein FlgE